VLSRLLRIGLTSLLIVASTLLILELVLQVGARFTTGRARDTSDAVPVRVLCLGDSHTYGVSVGNDESYPAQLQQRLNEVSPGRFAVINLGTPGISAIQMRNRVAAHAARYAPDLVIVWAGVNDNWNYSELSPGEATWWQRLDGWATRIRVYRFVRVWQHDRKLERSVIREQTDGIHQVSELSDFVEEGLDGGATWTIHYGGVKEVVEARASNQPEDLDGAEGRVLEALAGTLAWLRAAGSPVLMIRFPLKVGPFGAANRALDALVEMHDVPMVDAADAVSRVPDDELHWLYGAHPNAAVYGELAVDLVPRVLELTTE